MAKFTLNKHILSLFLLGSLVGGMAVSPVYAMMENESKQQQEQMWGEQFANGVMDNVESYIPIVGEWLAAKYNRHMAKSYKGDAKEVPLKNGIKKDLDIICSEVTRDDELVIYDGDLLFSAKIGCRTAFGSNKTGCVLNLTQKEVDALPTTNFKPHPQRAIGFVIGGTAVASFGTVACMLKVLKWGYARFFGNKEDREEDKGDMKSDSGEKKEKDGVPEESHAQLTQQGKSKQEVTQLSVSTPQDCQKTTVEPISVSVVANGSNKKSSII